METPSRARDKVAGLVTVLNNDLMDLGEDIGYACHPSAAVSSPSASSCASLQDRNFVNFSRGQLKLGITVQGNTLNVHIEEACGLKTQWKQRCNAYVQVQICPDDKVTSRSQTKVVMESNNPVFNQTLKFTLPPSDPKQRVMISAWHSDPVKKCADFLGCLSFGLTHLASKCARVGGVAGFYYLLSAEIGHRKHILARPATVTAIDTESEEKENSDKYEHITLTLKHRQPGYGFTVRGPHPIRVGRVKVGGPAYQSGLCKGDLIVAINGEKIGRNHDMQEVAAIIRKSEVTCVVDVKRSRVAKQPKCGISDDCIGTFQLNFEKYPSTRSLYHGNNDVNQKMLSYDSMQKSCESGNLKRKSVYDDVNECSSRKQSKSQENSDQNQNLFNEGLFCKPCSKSMFSRKSDCCQDNDDDIQKPGNQNNCEHINVISNRLDGHQATELLSKYKKWNPEMSAITTASSHVHSLVDSVLSCDSTRTDSLLDHAFHPSSDSSVCCSSLLNNTEQGHYDSYNNTTCGHYDSYNNTKLGHYESLNNSEYTNCDTVLSSSSSDKSRPSSPANSVAMESRICDITDFENLSSMTGFECSMASEQALQRDLCVRTMLKCEEQYVRLMGDGIQTYSRPLRFCVLSADQKEALFQNVEKLVSLSQYTLSKLLDNTKYSAEHTINGTINPGTGVNQCLASQYSHTVSLLCESYTDYITGLPVAMEILSKLRQYPEFEQLLSRQRSKCDLDIVDFLQQPVLHFEFLRRSFHDILLHTSVESEDYADLEQICQEFDEAACNVVL